MSAPRLATCLWFDGCAEEALRFYVDTVPGSHLGAVTRAPADTPGVDAGGVLTVEATVAGQPVMGLNGTRPGGERPPFTHAVSLALACERDEDLERVWERLLEGGKPLACGWLTDRYGVPWQVFPKDLPRLMADPNPRRARAAFDAMIGMVKLDPAAIRRAVAQAGEAPSAPGRQDIRA